MFFEKFEDTVQADDDIAEAVEAGQWDRVIDYVQPRGLRQARRALHARQAPQGRGGRSPPIAARDPRKNLRPHPALQIEGRTARRGVRQVRRRRQARGGQRHPAIKTLLQGLRHQRPGARHHRQPEFTDLATNPDFSTARLQGRARQKYRTLIPEYIKDYVSLNQFARLRSTVMLDTDTKRRIDTARDILVGKVPDPKSQVEQITIALIYKFMDDMDAEAEELGGKRKFFAGDFARYGWAKLMRSGLGGHEMLNLYAEAIAKMPENPGIPPLFRDIFKNAYLPYRDPETLRAFLKSSTTSATTTPSASAMPSSTCSPSSARRATPGSSAPRATSSTSWSRSSTRKKNETILDPACGTAGFLISAYKHILQRQHRRRRATARSRPTTKRRLASNFNGYDISPDMVRLSLVNLYLHGFTDPHIYEYDTLTSEERWNEFADVILANPPFMSPKGGIKPHSRFSVQSKRSEVLFVDYMAEHLTPTGRAGIIVPEGIIFQSQTAYKDAAQDARRELPRRRRLAPGRRLQSLLRREDLHPHSSTGPSPASRTTIGFFKVENDGFGLGAQRREGGPDDTRPPPNSSLKPTSKPSTPASCRWIWPRPISCSCRRLLSGRMAIGM